ncbi:T4SS effector phosphatidylinositol 3-Kinase RisK1 [Orientia tsutsugamushi]|uniref:LepB N-terminal domain-containing protein n=1 Tax=Orientia tsutsugamushi TaxID=784 RepID=A0A2U3RNL5_ORITS|nr:hypothetical protein [Orientia tsutsugamushi]KJV51409.1 hypothetical protein OTSKARP_1480 [Orientia tsutsugamushi str. Karp]SPR14833.1 Uncharacterised protein [Orientia tsutsugamushi]
MFKNIFSEDILINQLLTALTTSDQSKFTEDNIFLLGKNLAKVLNNIAENPSISNVEEYQKCFSDLNNQDLCKVLKILQNMIIADENKELIEIISSPLLYRLTKKYKAERAEELNNNHSQISSKHFKNSNIEELLRDRNIAKQDEFPKTEAKAIGISEGYIATEKSSGHIFLLKKFYKKDISIGKNLAKMPSEELDKLQLAWSDRRDAVQELLASSIYQLLLYGQAPKEELVIPDRSNADSLYIRSKFLDNAVQLSRFSGMKRSTGLKAEAKNLQKLEGFEKVIAACHILGELDYHSGNLIVQNGKTIAKVDHGRSLMQFYADFESMVSTTDSIFDDPFLNYNSAIQKGNLSFDINKYNDALKQMLAQIDEGQIDAIIEQKISELAKLGFDPKGFIGKVKFKGETFISTPINDYPALIKFYQVNLKENIKNMKEIVKATDVISRFSNVSSKFKKGGWLNAFATTSIKEPVLYAYNHNIKIDGKDALTWAIDNNYQMNSLNHSYIEVEKCNYEPQWQKDSNGKWQKKEHLVQTITNDIVKWHAADYILEIEKSRNDLKKQLQPLLGQSQNILTKKSVSKEIKKFDDSELARKRMLLNPRINYCTRIQKARSAFKSKNSQGVEIS